MTSILTQAQHGLNKEISNIDAKIQTEKNILEDDIKEIGQYLIFGGTILLLTGLPFINAMVQKIPDAVNMATKFIP